MDRADRCAGTALAWKQLCKGPEAGVRLAETSSWSGMSWGRGCRIGRQSLHRFGHGHGHCKTCFPFSLECETQEVGTSRWGSGWCPLCMEQCWRDVRCLENYLWELLCVHLGEETLPGHARSFWKGEEAGSHTVGTSTC